MKISELINILNEYKEKYGDIPVFTEEPEDFCCDWNSRELDIDDIVLGENHTYMFI